MEITKKELEEVFRSEIELLKSLEPKWFKEGLQKGLNILFYHYEGKLTAIWGIDSMYTRQIRTFPNMKSKKDVIREWEFKYSRIPELY